MGLGRKLDLEAKTPTFLLPPSRGGRTVGFHCPRADRSKRKITQIWEKPSSSRTASMRKKLDGSCGLGDDARLPGNAEFFCEAGVDGADGCQ